MRSTFYVQSAFRAGRPRAGRDGGRTVPRRRRAGKGPDRGRIMSPRLCRGRTRTGSYRGGTVDITPIGRDGATDIAVDSTRPGTEPISHLGDVARQ